MSKMTIQEEYDALVDKGVAALLGCTVAALSAYSPKVMEAHRADVRRVFAVVYADSICHKANSKKE